MGVLNVTPDSFSDGGRFVDLRQAVEHGLAMQEAGAGIIDVGGESTRPGAAAVPVADELDRVLPIIEALVAQLDIPVSIDTRKPEVMRAAVLAGAAMINDVNALQATGALETAARLGVPVCLMHMQGQPADMQEAPSYRDVVTEVRFFLKQRIAACVAQGIPRDRILVDPGFGFGKSLEHNLALLRDLDRIVDLGAPVLVGISRKSMLGKITGQPVDQRLPASLAAAVLAVEQGACMVRAHDVAETVQALQVVAAIRAAC